MTSTTFFPRTAFVEALCSLGFTEESAKNSSFKLITSNKDERLDMITKDVVRIRHPRYQRRAGMYAMLDVYDKSFKTLAEAADLMRDRLRPEVYEALKNTPEEVLDYSRDFRDATAFSILSLVRGRYLAHPEEKTVMVEYPETGEIVNEIHYGDPIEVPQHMYMRVAAATYPKPEDMEKRISLYHKLSNRIISPATPVFVNLGFRTGMPTSCMTTTLPNSIGGNPKKGRDGIFDVISFIADTSKNGAGHGVSMNQVAKGGKAKGIFKLMMVLNEVIEYINQGSRKGAVTLGLTDMHLDVEAFISAGNLAAKAGEHVSTAKLSLSLSNVFLKTALSDGDTTWYLFNPAECPELFTLHGEALEAAYYKRVADPSVVKKRTCAYRILQAAVNMMGSFSQPFINFRCNMNGKNNCEHVDIVDVPNLCQEMCLPSTPGKYTGTCNLSALNLSKFVNTETKTFDYEALGQATQEIVHYLNRVVDLAHSPHDTVNNTNRDMRPLGIGVAGFADMVHMLDMPIVTPDSVDSRSMKLNPDLAALNINIWRCMYYNALVASMESAKVHGPCELFFNGSPASKGILNQDMYRAEGLRHPERDYSRHDWDGEYPGQPGSWDDLREQIKKHGLRNQTMLSVQPTASTAQIMNVSEAAEFYSTNIYQRRVGHGEYTVVNEHMCADLMKNGYWTQEVMDHLRNNHGSIFSLKNIPAEIRAKYLTMWEIPDRITIDMAADRQVYICHMQSMNLYPRDNSAKSLIRILQYGWKSGLKTGVYYMQSRASAKPINFGRNVEALVDAEDDDICTSCVN